MSTDHAPAGDRTIDFTGRFEGTHVVVTGACGIFGRWIAEAFARAGADVWLSDRRADALGALADELVAAWPGQAFPVHATELASDASLAELGARVVERWGAPDVLVNNAGIYPTGFLLDTSNEDWDAVMNVNVRAAFVLARDMATAMIRAGRPGSIVNISSGASGKMRRTVVPYCLSKAALDRLTKGLALELAGYDIRVNAVEPGFAAGSEVSTVPKAHVESVAANIPLGRVSSPTDAAEAVLYLCSANAAYITGATLSVDGGNSAGTMTVFQDKRSAL